MKRLLALVTLLCIHWAAPVLGHDIGVSQTELIELEGGQYTLSVRTGGAVASMYGSPILPEHCDYPESPRGVQAAEWRTYEFVCDGSLSAKDTLQLPWRRDGVVIKAIWLDGSEVERLFKVQAGRIVVPLDELQVGSGSLGSAAKRYTELGIEHILLGFDHLLFVLALLLIVRSPWTLVKTITAFTVAHSITLGLATLGVIDVPTRPVEAAIALSIMFLCVEIVHAQQQRMGMTYRFPWLVAFTFGLLHGLGFAGALADIGIPQGEIPVALLFFNVGVEIGQLLFVVAVLLFAWLLRGLGFQKQAWARVLAAYFIGTLASFWFIERVVTWLPIS